MHLVLRYASGRLAEAILLAAGPDRMRVAVRRINETVELRRQEGHWVSEAGDRVEIEGWLADGSSGMSQFCAIFGQRTSRATH